MPAVDLLPISARILTVRQALGLSQAQLGAKCGLTRGAIAHVEAGRTKDMGVDTLIRIAYGLNVRPGWLLDGVMPKDRRGRISAMASEVRVSARARPKAGS
jgi:transcriptional regulator with XRE-family HTH domain